ncbi:succinate--CoA ligase subunit alpha [Rubidibacter lacunae]|nr:CoA-binding protein [Rubidibacter lacunae]
MQGIDRPLGAHAAAQMRAYGTQVVAGVRSGWGGADGSTTPTFDLVEQAVAHAGDIDLSLIFVEPYRVLDAGLEAIASGIHQLAIATCGVPPLDIVRLLRQAEGTNTTVFGPGSAGILVPGKVLLGIHEPQFFQPGSLGILSCSDALTAGVAQLLGRAGYGQSIVVSLGSEAIAGTSYEPWLEVLERDPNTEAILLVGQAGSGDEVAAADFIASDVGKPVFAYLAGLSLPPTRHNRATPHLTRSGADDSSTANKLAALSRAGVHCAPNMDRLPEIVRNILSQSPIQPAIPCDEAALSSD